MKALFVLTFVLICMEAKAAVPHAVRSSVMRDLAFVRTVDFSKGLDASIIKPVEGDHITNDDIFKVIPKDMAPSSNGGMVAAQIIDHSLSNWFNSEAVKNSDM